MDTYNLYLSLFGYPKRCPCNFCAYFGDIPKPEEKMINVIKPQENQLDSPLPYKKRKYTNDNDNDNDTDNTDNNIFDINVFDNEAIEPTSFDKELEELLFDYA